MNCTHCNARIQADALTCPYCGHETPNSAKARAAAAEQLRYAQHQATVEATTARQRAVASLEGAARTALYWALGGVAVCCLPVGSVVGIVLGLRVRKNAAGLSVPAPWQSMAALVLSGLWIAVYLLFATLIVIDERAKSARIAELRAQTLPTAAAVELDPQTACGLVELTLLEGGAGEKGGTMGLFRCEGAVEKTAEGRAVIKDVEFSRQSSDKPLRVDGCLSRGSRWKVDAIGTGPGCHQGRDGGE